MKKIILSFLFILAGVFVVDRLGGAAMWWVNQHTQDWFGPKIKYLADDVHEDVLLLGASRCHLHYVPSILRDSIAMSVYNGGITTSNNIFAHYITLNHILAHHTPKVICLEVMIQDYERRDDSFNTITFFAPYVGRNEQADSVLRMAGIYWPCRISHLYRFNAKAASNLAGLLVSRQVGGENGYLPNARPAHFPEALDSVPAPTTIDSTKVAYIRKFINICKAKDIQLIFTVSPCYTCVDSAYYAPLRHLAKCYDIPFLDYHTTGLFHDHPEYFKDEGHLWDRGARIYSQHFAHDLKSLLSSQ